MALPKIDVPISSLTLPSGKQIDYRSFLVKEDKIILTAAQDGSDQAIRDAIRQIVTNCVITEGFDVDKQPVFDVEYVLLTLNIQSVGSKIENEYRCDNVTGDKVCGTPFKIEYDLKAVETVGNEKPKMDIKLGENIGVQMQFPTFDSVKDTTTEDKYGVKLLRSAVKLVYDQTQVYPLADQTDEEVIEFFDSLTKDQFDKIEKWLADLPRFEVNKEHTCTNCGFVHKFIYRDLASFF